MREPFDFRDAEGPLADLRDRFTDLGFTEEAVCRLLGVPDIPALRLGHLPIYDERLARGVPLHDLIRLSLLGGSVSEGRLAGLFSDELVGALDGIGLLGRTSEGEIQFRVSFYPCQGKVFATDHRFTLPLGDRIETPEEPVMYLGADSYLLARMTIREEIGRALDLCTGSGVQGILAAEHAEEVTCIDLNPRALAFCRLNAHLNGVADRIRLLRGSLAEGVTGPFDLVTGNPPFVPSPEQKLLFRDGGPGGEEILARILGDLDRLLSRSGRAQVVTTIVRQRERLYRRRLKKWLGGTDMNLLLLEVGEDPAHQYAATQNRRPFSDTWEAYRTRLKSWLESYEESEIEAVGGGVLTVTRNRHRHGMPWIIEQKARFPSESCGERVGAHLRLLEETRPLLFFEEVVERVPRADRDVRLVTEKRLADPERPPHHLLRSDGPIARQSYTLTPDVADLVSRIDGKRTVGALADELTSSSPGKRVFALVTELIERGFLTWASGR